MKFSLGLLALAGTALSCAHHDDEVVPDAEREELLKKWDQEVSFHIYTHRHIYKSSINV